MGGTQQFTIKENSKFKVRHGFYRFPTSGPVYDDECQSEFPHQKPAGHRDLVKQQLVGRLERTRRLKTGGKCLIQ